jgi:sugar phosphate permease
LAVASLAIFGLGQGVFGSPNTKLIMAHAPQDKLGIAGSINALARNMGMVSGIALSVSVLYGVMSGMLGRRVSAFVPERPDAFVAGMHAAFWAASALILVTILLTSLRSLASRRAALERKLP